MVDEMHSGPEQLLSGQSEEMYICWLHARLAALSVQAQIVIHHRGLISMRDIGQQPVIVISQSCIMHAQQVLARLRAAAHMYDIGK